MDQETLDKIKKFAPPMVLLDPRVIFAGIYDNKRRTALLESIYADINRQYELYTEQVQKWKKTKKELEKRKTRNVKVEKMLKSKGGK